MTRTNRFKIPIALLFTALACTACASTASLSTEDAEERYPKASEDASVVLSMISNVPETTFYIDSTRIATGQRVKALINNNPHTVVADPTGYRSKESYIQPPYFQESPLRFTFMIGDKVQEGAPVAEQQNPEEDEEKSQDNAETQDKGPTNSPPLIDTQISETNADRPEDVAVVIGIREYQNPDVPNVDYAVRDARVVKKYLTRTLGFREENIIYVENADAATMTRIFGTADDPRGQLYDWVKPGESSVFVYYSGHGAPNPETENAYFVPSNTNPNYLSQNGYPVNQLYENLGALPTESITVVLEACFSGVSESGAVVQDISPAVLSVENPVMAMEDGLAFTAGAADQVSTWYDEKQHGLFTYYFLKGLRGNADANEDEAVTAQEMEAYLGEKVPYRAQRMHSRKQTPQVVGSDKERVLVQYTTPSEK